MLWMHVVIEVRLENLLKRDHGSQVGEEACGPASLWDAVNERIGKMIEARLSSTSREKEVGRRAAEQMVRMTWFGSKWAWQRTPWVWIKSMKKTRSVVEPAAKCSVVAASRCHNYR
jgi:hypothetical protein